MCDGPDYKGLADDLERNVDRLEDVIASNKKVAEQMGDEIDYLQAAHAQTLARKGNLMRDWLADQMMKHKLRCQIRGLGGEPIV